MTGKHLSRFLTSPLLATKPASNQSSRHLEEARLLEEARQELRDGKGLSEESLESWLEEFVNDDTPVSTPRR